MCFSMCVLNVCACTTKLSSTFASRVQPCNYRNSVVNNGDNLFLPCAHNDMFRYKYSSCLLCHVLSLSFCFVVRCFSDSMSLYQYNFRSVRVLNERVCATNSEMYRTRQCNGKEKWVVTSFVLFTDHWRLYLLAIAVVS